MNSHTCQSQFVENSYDSSEPWQIPSYFGRDMGPMAYRRPTTCPLFAAIDAESHLTIGTAGSMRNSSGGTEATLGPMLHGPTPFDYNHSHIVQPSDNRLSQIFTRDNGNYPQKYADNPHTFNHTA